MKLPKGLFIKHGKIYIRYYDPFDKRTREKSTGFEVTKENIKLAKEYRNEVMNRLRKINYNDYILSLSEALEMFLEAKKYKQQTINLFRYAMQYLINAVGDIPIDSVTEFHYNKLLSSPEWIELSNNSKSIYSRHLSIIFNYFKKRNLIEKNPITTIKLEYRRPRAIPSEDLQAILNYLKEHNKHGYNLIKFLYLTGLRISEAISLTWDNINFEKKIIVFHNHKAKREDVRPLLDKAIEHLIEMKKESVSEKLFPYSTRFCSFFYRAQAKLWGDGKKSLHKYNIHQLRKSFISKLIEEGISLEDTQVLAGHTDPRTTQRYYIEYQLSKIAERVNKKVDFNV